MHKPLTKRSDNPPPNKQRTPADVGRLPQWAVRLLAIGAVLSSQFHAAASCAKATPQTPVRPNVVLIISDDQAWTDYGFMGNAEVRTPNLDRLAAESLTFARGYVTTALCSPSLATLLTGLYPHQHGITGNDPADKRPREPWLERFFQHPQLPRLLAAAGYGTLHTGKYWMREPAAAGFTASMGETDRHGGKALAIGRETLTPLVEFIDRAAAAQQPFFVWYAPLLPHQPHDPPERLLQHYAQLQPDSRAKYYAMIEWLDETCGELLKHLDERQLTENTLIVFLADNGWNEFGKSSPYENGVRTPILLRWPARVQPQFDRTHLASNIDIVPTILAACDVPAPANLPGINLLDAAAVARREAIFCEQYAHDMASPTEPAQSLWSRSCIEGNWKLIAWEPVPPAVKPSLGGERHKDPASNLELYDLARDPHETRNLAAEHPDIVRTLQRRLAAEWTAQ